MIGIARVRNESLIIADTLRHFLGYCDEVLLYDDCSTDNTVDIASSFDRVTVIRGRHWAQDRRPEETRHRGLLLENARTLGHDWALCFDADERLVGEMPALTADGYTFRLFDGYLTADSKPYTGGELAELPRQWGPEYRDILMLFRTDKSEYHGDGNRCPITTGRIERAPMYVKHFGKCISVEQWEETCRYYTLPGWTEKYRRKWEARKGKAIHTKSDFGRKLYTWGGAIANRVRL